MIFGLPEPLPPQALLLHIILALLVERGHLVVVLLERLLCRKHARLSPFSPAWLALGSVHVYYETVW